MIPDARTEPPSQGGLTRRDRTPSGTVTGT
jgi:hypothetical protein